MNNGAKETGTSVHKRDDPSEIREEVDGMVPDELQWEKVRGCKRSQEPVTRYPGMVTLARDIPVSSGDDMPE